MSFTLRPSFVIRALAFGLSSVISVSPYVFLIKPLMFHRLSLTIAVLALTGCAAPWTPRLTVPSRNTVIRQQLTVHSDSPMPGLDGLLDELILQRDDIARQLMVPISAAPIHIYLFNDESQFRSFMRLHHPDFPTRRAFFLETKNRMEIYAQAGERMATDLRHEVTHGYLHSAVPNLPLWLDEGLAKYYEVPRGRHGLNRPLVELFKNRPPSKPWSMNWQRLEKIQPDEEMTLDEYAEAWAWVHFLLEDRPEYRDVLCHYLADLRRDGTATPLSTRMTAVVPQPETVMIDHLQKILGENSKK